MSTADVVIIGGGANGTSTAFHLASLGVKRVAYMVRMREIEPDLRGSALVRGGGLGWPLLALGKCMVDLRQVWENRSRLGARFTAALPLAALYELTLFAGGVGALLRLPPPRWS